MVRAQFVGIAKALATTPLAKARAILKVHVPGCLVSCWFCLKVWHWSPLPWIAFLWWLIWIPFSLFLLISLLIPGCHLVVFMLVFWCELSPGHTHQFGQIADSSIWIVFFEFTPNFTLPEKIRRARPF